MQTTKLLLTSTLALAVLAGCERPGDAGTEMQDSPAAEDSMTPGAGQTVNPATTPATSPTHSDAGAPGISTEAGLLGLLMAVNDHEIKAAEQARAKGVDGPTLDYANLMHAEHSKNQAETRALNGASQHDSGSATDEVAAQKRKGEAELSAMAPLAKDAYEKAYIDAMVKGHAEVLAMLDDKLIPGVRTPAVQQHLAMTREHVAMHLEKARELQSAEMR